MRRFLILLLCLLAGIPAASARVRQIGVHDGLSSRQVYEIEEDGDGFVWIYTNSGLDRFDGSAIKHYRLDERLESNNHILSATSMYCDFADGVLWVALKSGDIYRYDRERDAFVREAGFPDGETAIYHFTFAADHSLLVCTNKGIYRCVGGDSWQEPEAVALDGKLTRAIVSDGDGGFYVGTDGGVYHMASPDDARPSFVAGTAGMHVLSLCLSCGRLFVGTFSSGVRAIDTANDRILPLLPPVPSIPVNAITAWGDDRVLLGVDGAGVYLVDARSGRIVEHYHDDGPADICLSGNTVTDVHVDSRGGIWVATSHCGLNYIPSYNRAVSVLRSERGNASSLISDYVNVVFEDSDGAWWFGTDIGLSRHDPVSGSWRRYLRLDDYVANVILAVGEDAEGRIWVGSYGNGVHVIDKRTDRVERIPRREPGSEKGSGTEYVVAIRGDRAGNVWIGGINGDITRYDLRTDEWHYYDEDCLGTIVPDTDDALLFGGNKGVGRYDAAADRFEWTTRFDTVSIRYPVRCLMADPSDGVLWIGTTGDGLIRYDRRRGTARRYTVADGLSTNSIYSIVRDHTGAAWICTESDLYRIAPGTGTLTRFTYYFLSGRNTFNQTAAAVSRNGSVLLGSAEGCVVFDPRACFGESVNGAILLTDFKLHGRSVTPGAEGSPLRRNINLTERIELGSTQNSFEIGFAAIDYASPLRTEFEYMLEGFDEGWIRAGAAHSVRYADLPPGKYAFRLRTLDLYNNRILGERSVAVVIRQPLWLTWWAKLIYALALTGGLVHIVNYVRNYNREKYIRMQIQTFTTMAHDIRAPMSLIKAPLLEIEMEKNLSDKVRDNLAYVRTGLDKTIGILSEMLEIRHISKPRRRLAVERCDMREYLQIKVEEYALLAKLKNIALVCSVPDDMPCVMADIDILEHVIDNLISNALKYTKEGEIRLSAAPAGRRHWRLSVSDTGIGISKRDARHIFRHLYRAPDAVKAEQSGMGLGLLITRQLVRSHKGRIAFESTPGRGTTFTVTLPLRFPDRYLLPVPPADAAADGQPENEPAEASRRYHIFLLEDDPDMLAYIKQALETEYRVTASSDSLQMLKEIRRECPDLVITDVVMPRLRGDELCRLIKTDMATSHIPVILLSGLASREDIIAGLEVHADDYVVKPFDIILLKARIRNIIKSRRVVTDGREPEEADFSNELDYQFMTKVKETVDAHLSDPEFSIQQFCQELGMSHTSAYNKIKALTGQSINELIRIARLNRGKELLASRRYNISEVAYMVGFSDPKYFSTCFRKQFGISPSKL